MATHDYVIANGTGAAVRSDLNGALAAIVSQNSSATEPSPSYAYQRWADTTAGVMKMRNGANNAWITLYQLDGEWSTIAFENGTAAAPSIYFKDSGTDTGIYSPGADQVAISTGGTGRITVDASGNVNIDSNTLYVDAVNNRVGIGTTSLSVNLEVRGGGSGVDAEVRISSNQNAALLTFAPAGSNTIRQYAIGSAVGGSLVFVDNTASTQRAAIDSSGRLLVGGSPDSGGALLQVFGDRIRVGTAKTPASASDTGTAGEICWDASYIYVCTATNTWKRTAIATW